jgi:hypothetical protein
LHWFREAALAQWKDEHRAAEAEAARKVAAAEAAAGRAEEDLRAAQAEISALHQSAAERCVIHRTPLYQVSVDNAGACVR